MVANNPLIRPYFFCGGGGIGGVPLNSHGFCLTCWVSGWLRLERMMNRNTP